MAYVTSSQIVSRLGNDTAVQLTTDSGSSVNTSLIDTYIAGVEGKINMAVRKRTAATITQAAYPQTFAMLCEFATVMVIARLAARRPPVSADWEADNKEAVEWLKMLAEGKVALPDAALNEPGMVWGSEDQNAAAER